MNLNLERYRFTADGIFGYLKDDENTLSLSTLEHSFIDESSGRNFPKLSEGTYTCKRGMHKLLHTPEPFEAFEVLGVPDFQGKPVEGILFHVGNFNEDSEGCILLGLASADSSILSSRGAFERFMAAQEGVDEFTLEVKDFP